MLRYVVMKWDRTNFYSNESIALNWLEVNYPFYMDGNSHDAVQGNQHEIDCNSVDQLKKVRDRMRLEERHSRTEHHISCTNVSIERMLEQSFENKRKLSEQVHSVVSRSFASLVHNRTSYMSMSPDNISSHHDNRNNSNIWLIHPNGRHSFVLYFHFECFWFALLILSYRYTRQDAHWCTLTSVVWL